LPAKKLPQDSPGPGNPSWKKAGKKQKKGREPKSTKELIKYNDPDKMNG
jgi:hypothetical protein